MESQLHFDSWFELEAWVRQLKSDPSVDLLKSGGTASHLLFRGQANAEWALETTLDRIKASEVALSEYYRLAAIAKTQIETFTSRVWADIEYPIIRKKLEDYDSLAFSQFPHYDYLVYLRHHGFPSPLLDWSRSLYVAAYFACHRPAGDRVALFVYQERSGSSKIGSSAEPQLKVLGPNVRSHPRHFLQQGEYTVCVQYGPQSWKIGRHAAVFDLNREGQDNLWKLTIPRLEAIGVMRQLQEYNINAFSLFQTEEALLESLARTLLPQSAW